MIDYFVRDVAPFDNKPKGVFGIEVEVEGDNLPKIDPLSIWKVVKDGSLRGEAAEYVLRKPLDLKEAVNGIIHLNEMLADSPLRMSFRTSVHVHVNVLNMRMSQMKRFIITSFLLENLLVAFSGEERIGNRFCLRVVDAEFQLNYIKLLMQETTQLHRIANDEAKYAAINLVTIRNYGSVEFRSFQGTTNPEQIKNWIEILNKIYEFALKDERTCKQLCSYAANDPSGFLEEVMKDKSDFLKFPDYRLGIQEAEEALFFIASKEVLYDEKGDIEEVKAPRAAKQARMLFDEIAVNQMVNEIVIPRAPLRAAEPREIEFDNEGPF